MLSMSTAPSSDTRRARSLGAQAGFSLPELLISVTILLIISSTVTSALLQMTSSQQTIANRTQLHAGVRSATELLQQEIGQAGRIALPGTQPGGSVTLAANVLAGATTATVACVVTPPVPGCGIFQGELLIVDPGGWNQTTLVGSEETVKVLLVNTGTNQITISSSIDSTGATIQSSFVNAHLSGVSVRALGGFATGIVPPALSGFTNGSTDSVLKLYGDINGDGSMVYVEYSCDPLPGGSGNLYRNVMAYDQTSAKLAPTDSQVLLNNIKGNPNNTPCFTYMPSTLPVVSLTSYVLDVAITLTVQTQLVDPVTKQFQLETKALLNVSPRNVFNVWQLASAGALNRVQPMPPTVTALLH
jgi:prepilin-type N-terminal cleavage/methylation domain-containing protein